MLKILIGSNGSGKTTFLNKLHFENPGVIFIGSDDLLEDRIHEILPFITISNLKNTLLNMLRILQPNLEDLLIENNEISFVIYNKIIPSFDMGSGTQRLSLICLALLASKDKILLIDSVERSIHISQHNVLKQLIHLYIKELNIELYVSTHSPEFLSYHRDETKEQVLEFFDGEIKC